MEKPDGYSQAALEETAKLAEENYQGPASGENRPNIIFIMNESWSDLRVLGNLETTQEYMPFVNSLTQSVVKGNTYVKILGGLTANSEFEALTGDTLAFLSPTAIPYELQVNHDMPSIATVLKEQGYQTMAMHPSGSAVWNREKVYGYFGFDDFIDQEKFQTPYLYLRSLFFSLTYRFRITGVITAIWICPSLLQRWATFWQTMPDTCMTRKPI